MRETDSKGSNASSRSMYNFPDERLGQFSDPVFYLMINGDLKSDNIDALFTGGGQA